MTDEIEIKISPRSHKPNNRLYGGMDEPEVKIIDVFICKLRKKLALATEGANYNETVWGRGYVLCDPQPRQAENIMA